MNGLFLEMSWKWRKKSPAGSFFGVAQSPKSSTDRTRGILLVGLREINKKHSPETRFWGFFSRKNEVYFRLHNN